MITDRCAQHRGVRVPSCRRLHSWRSAGEGVRTPPASLPVVRLHGRSALTVRSPTGTPHTGQVRGRRRLRRHAEELGRAHVAIGDLDGDLTADSARIGPSAVARFWT